MTCEEYVIGRVTTLEEENEALKNDVEAVKEAYLRLEHKLADIRRIIEKRANVKKLQDGGTYYISFESIWNRSWDEKDYDDYHRFLGYFNIPSEVEEKEEEDGSEE